MFGGGIKTQVLLEYSSLFQCKTHSIQIDEFCWWESKANLISPWGSPEVNVVHGPAPPPNLSYNPWLLEVGMHWSEENSAAGYNDPKWQGQ